MPLLLYRRECLVSMYRFIPFRAGADVTKTPTHIHEYREGAYSRPTDRCFDPTTFTKNLPFFALIPPSSLATCCEGECPAAHLPPTAIHLVREKREEEQQGRARRGESKTRLIDLGGASSCLPVCFAYSSSSTHTNRSFQSSSNTMATPFQDFLREREYTGPPLVVSREWPPTDGTDFIEVANEDSGAATVHRGCLVIPSDQVSERFCCAIRFRARSYVLFRESTRQRKLARRDYVLTLRFRWSCVCMSDDGMLVFLEREGAVVPPSFFVYFIRHHHLRSGGRKAAAAGGWGFPCARILLCDACLRFVAVHAAVCGIPEDTNYFVQDTSTTSINIIPLVVVILKISYARGPDVRTINTYEYE